MSKSIIKFPDSKRRFTLREEKEIRICVNKITNILNNDNPFVSLADQKDDVEDLIQKLIKKIFEMNEEK